MLILLVIAEFVLKIAIVIVVIVQTVFAISLVVNGEWKPVTLVMEGMKATPVVMMATVAVVTVLTDSVHVAARDVLVMETVIVIVTIVQMDSVHVLTSTAPALQIVIAIAVVAI